MSLIPLTVYDNLRRVCCSVFASSSQFDHSNIASRLIATASIVDVLRWRNVSKDFHKAATARLSKYRQLHVRVYPGLSKLHAKGTIKTQKAAADLNWHPTSCLLICEVDKNTIGIAIDSKPAWKDIASLLSLLEVFRMTVQQVVMDSPIVEILVKEVNSKKVNALLVFFQQTRKCGPHMAWEEHTVAPINKTTLPIGPLFPNLKQFTVTSSSAQLAHLSRLIQYSVAVDMIYHQKDIDLVCLQVVLGESWCRSKQRLFRHVNKFKQWSDASSLGVKYLQQFQASGEKKKFRARY